MPPSRTGRLVDRLSAIAAKDAKVVVGLMSGTSHDAVDAAVVRVAGAGEKLTAAIDRFESFEYGPELRSRIRSTPGADVAELARLNFDVGEAFGRAALAVMKGAGLVPEEVDLIGSHGQTVCHIPPSEGRGGATLQIGEPDVIAQRTGVVTVSDFRTADVAAGGSGAPLIPLVDWLLFRSPGRRRVMLNIGGMANVTYLGGEFDDVVAFDTGPGNALMDEVVDAATDGRETFDRDGGRALEGSVSAPALEAFLADPYFSLSPPKSTGREAFGKEAALRLAGLVTGAVTGELSEDGLRDVLATAAMVTAASVHEAVVSFTPGVDEVFVSGGGVRNVAVMSDLGSLFDPVPVVSTESLGVDPDAKEALGFAVLAVETISGRPGNVTAATGARRPVVLGKISTGL